MSRATPSAAGNGREEDALHAVGLELKDAHNRNDKRLSRAVSVGKERVEDTVRANGKQRRCNDTDRDTDESVRLAEREEPHEERT